MLIQEHVVLGEIRFSELRVRLHDNVEGKKNKKKRKEFFLCIDGQRYQNDGSAKNN